ncbi:MAG: hypothetical protein OSA02_04675 [Schleiferiaceae bacterium]|nr:hypothetical protein [Schleiferiaceae bacterium]
MKNLYLLGFLLFSLISSAQNALHFDGTNDYVSTSAGNITGTSARTVEAWVRTTANCVPGATSGGTQQVIADMGSFTTGGRYTLNLLWGNSIRIEVGGSGLSANTAINDSLWHHLAAVYNPLSNKKHTLYIDGIAVISGNITTTVNTANGALRIGQRIDAARHFDGEIDELRVWNVARTDNEIYDNYALELCGAPSGLVAYYSFNEGTPGSNNSTVTSLPDLQGTNTGTLNNFGLAGSSSNWTLAQNMSSAYRDTLTSTVCSGLYAPDGITYWDSTGSYDWTFVDTSGCDSIITYDLTITSVDTTTGYTTSSPPTLFANATNATFQWVNCADSSALTGENSSSFVPSINGHYAVIITQNGCSSWSRCFTVQGIGIEEEDLLPLYPNPTSGIVNLPLNWIGKVLRITESGGGEVWRKLAQEQVDLSKLPAGTYIFSVQHEHLMVIKH